MNHEFQLKLQAYLDGELVAGEVKSFEAQLQSAPEAQALLAELRSTRTALLGNEPEHTLPETREFFWSKIERAIHAEEKTVGRPGNPFSLSWLFRYWPQLSGAGAAALLLVIAALLAPSRGVWEDIENPLAESSTFTFRSEPDRMTLVWISDHTTDADEDTESVN